MPADLGTVADGLRRLTVHVRDGGAGVIWRSDGLIITNAHVARSNRQRVELFDGRVVDATVTRRDVRRDLALLRADFSNASAVRIRDSNELRSGELAIAIGHPLGFRGALSTGVIHGHGPIAGWDHLPWVQADIRLAPGNSGGPLADAEGRVVGINTMIAGRLGLAVPSNAVRAFVARETQRAALGVTIRPVQAGLLVLEVQPDSPAARASLLPGDLLTGLSIAELYDAIQAGGIMTLRFARGGRRVREVAVRLAA